MSGIKDKLSEISPFSIVIGAFSLGFAMASLIWLLFHFYPAHDQISEFKEYKNKYISLKEEFDKKQNELNEKHNKNIQHQNIINKKEGEIDKLKEEIRKDSNKSNDNEIKNLQDKITAYEADIINLQKRYDNIIKQKDQEIANLTSKIHNNGPIINSTDNKTHKNKSSLLQPDKVKPFYNNNIINIEVVSFSFEGTYFNLILKHTNLTKQPIEIFAYEHRQNTLLIDDHSNQYQYLAPHEIGNKDELYLSDRGRRIELAPGIPKVLPFSFACNNKQYGLNFIFSSKYGFSYERGNPNAIHVAIKNINLN